MNLPQPNHFDRCINCGDYIHYFQFIYSTNQLGMSWCSPCEHDYRTKSKRATGHEQTFFKELLEADILAELQHFDGYKTVDIAIHNLQLHIEVYGDQHQQPAQALTDLKRSLYSMRDNVYTLRVPNTLVKSRIAETVKSIRNLYDSKHHTRAKDRGIKHGSLF